MWKETYMPAALPKAGHFEHKGVGYEWDPAGHGSVTFAMGLAMVKIAIAVYHSEPMFFGSGSDYPRLNIYIDDTFIAQYWKSSDIEPKNLRAAVEAALDAWLASAAQSKKAALSKIG